MDWKTVAQLAATLMGGGAMGAIITALIQAWRTRIPAIHYTIEQDRIFSKGSEDAINATATVRHGDKTYDFENVSLVKIRLKNRSMHDYETFAFGISTPPGFQVFQFNSESSDRYHVLGCQQSPTPADPDQHLDFIAMPFNRNDAYTIKLYGEVGRTPIDASHFRVVSAASVNLISTTAFEETPRRMADAATTAVGMVAGFSAISVLAAFTLVLASGFTTRILGQKVMRDSEQLLQKQEQLSERNEKQLQRSEALQAEIKQFAKEHGYLMKSDEPPPDAAKPSEP
jgi:hypothetical protein